MASPRCCRRVRDSCCTVPSRTTAVTPARGNAAFDRSLRAQDPGVGVRDLRDLERIAAAGDMALEDDVAMPSNNRILVWRKAPG